MEEKQAASETAIDLVVNGDAIAVDRGASVGDLIRSLGRDPRLVAVERNGEIVPRAELDSAELAPGDRLEIVQFVQGG